MKVEVAVLVPNGPYGLCGRKKATLNRVQSSGAMTVKVEVAVLVLDSPSLTVRAVSVDVKQH